MYIHVKSYLRLTDCQSPLCIRVLAVLKKTALALYIGILSVCQSQIKKLLPFLEHSCFWVGLAVVDVYYENGLFPYLIFYAESLDEENPDSREIGQLAYFWHGRQQTDLSVNHLHQFLAESVAIVSLIEKREDGLQTVNKQWSV